MTQPIFTLPEGFSPAEPFVTLGENRRCESCGGAMPNRTHRQRDKKGRLVCDSCSPSLGPSWASYSALSDAERVEMQRREAEALTSVRRVGRMQREVIVDGDGAPIKTVAHDSGDGALINHCPFCGSGSVTGRSDGGVECDFCNNIFTVQVQPPHPNMPQTVDGQPVTPPGMPGGEEKEISGTDDPSVHESEDGVAANPLDDPNNAKKPNPFAKGQPPAKGAPPQGSPPAGDDGAKKKSLPPWMKNKKSFRTAKGASLPVEDYMAHLALEFADDREAVLDSVRATNVQREAAVPGYPDGVPYECPVCGEYRNAKECTVCKDRAANRGIRNPNPLDYLFHRLFPSGASASLHDEEGQR